MAKVIDVNERTLEKQKKDYLVVCKAGQILMAVERVGAFIAFLCGLLATGMSIGGVCMDFKIAGSYGVEGIISGINAAVIGLGCFAAGNFGYKAFKTLKSGESPFRYDIADKVMGAGFAMTVCGAIGTVLWVVYSLLEANGTFIGDVFFSLGGGLDLLVFGLFLIALSYVLSYGCKLQQESDETL